MVENNKCPKCHYIYEVSWDDSIDEYYNEDINSDLSIELDELYACYCPFCGIHRDYGTEPDSNEEDWL